jgi:hypothetical protein
MNIDYKPIVARLVSAALAGIIAKLATLGIAVEISPETQAVIILAVYGGLHSLSKQLFGKRKEGDF